MLTNNQIKEIFGGDENHFALIEYFLQNGCEVIYAENDGVLVCLAGVYALFGCTDEGMKNALGVVDKLDCIVCSSEKESDFVLKKYSNITRKKACYQILYRDYASIPLPQNTEVKELLPNDENIDFVTKTYTLGFSREDIKRLMQNFTFYATYTDGEISGYIGRHDEGSIGLLEIMPKFRRMGLGAFLVDYSIKMLKLKGEIAYCNIETKNEKSLAMHLKMGHTPSEKFVYWCV